MSAPLIALLMPAGAEVRLEHHGQPMVWAGTHHSVIATEGGERVETINGYACVDPECLTTVDITVREVPRCL